MHPRSWVITEPYTEDKPGSLDSPLIFPIYQGPGTAIRTNHFAMLQLPAVRIQSRSLYCPPFVVPCSCQTASSSYNKRSFLSPSSAQAFFGTTRLACGLQGIIEKLADTKVPAIFLRAGTRDSRPNKNRAPKTKTRPLLQRHKTVPPVQAPGDGV